MEKEIFGEIVAFAILKEQEAVDAYTAAAGMVKHANVRGMLLGLARQEEGHKQKLMGIDSESLPETSLKEIPDLKISDYTDDVQITADMSYQDLLTIAMKREEVAHNLYTRLASISDEPEIRQLFEFLAQEEAKHKLALEKEYDEHILTEN